MDNSDQNNGDSETDYSYPVNPETLPKAPNNKSKIDLAIKTVVKANPNLPPNQIANHVIDLGAAKSKQAVYNKLYSRDYKRAGVQEIESYHNEFLHRELAPLALRNIRKVYKDKELKPKERFSYDKLIADKMYGEKHVHTGQQPVNIGSIERIQIMVQNSLTNETPETVSSNELE